MSPTKRDRSLTVVAAITVAFAALIAGVQYGHQANVRRTRNDLRRLVSTHARRADVERLLGRSRGGTRSEPVYAVRATFGDVWNILARYNEVDRLISIRTEGMELGE